MIFAFLIGFINVENADSDRVSMVKNINSMWNLSNTSNSTRILYWKSSLKMFYKNPVLGIGTGNWFAEYPEHNQYIYNDENIYLNDDINPHNDYLKILSENGLAGFMIYIILIIYILISLIKSAYKQIIYLPVCLSFIGISVFSLFSFPSENVSAMIIFFTTIGVGIRNENNAIIKKSSGIKFLLVSFIILSIIIFAYNFKHYESEKIYLSAMYDKAGGDYPGMLDKLKSINLIYYPVDANKVPLEFYEGTGYYELKNFEKSLECYEKCKLITPYMPSILNNLASAYYMNGNFEKSDSLLSIVIKNCPDYIEPEINLLAMCANNRKDSLARILISDIKNKKFDNSKVKNYTNFLNIQDYYDKKSN